MDYVEPIKDRTIELTIAERTLPRDVHGIAVTGRAPDTVTIIINSADHRDRQAAAFLRECLAIFRGDPADGFIRELKEPEARRDLKRILELMEHDQRQAAGREQ